MGIPFVSCVAWNYMQIPVLRVGSAMSQGCCSRILISKLLFLGSLVLWLHLSAGDEPCSCSA